MKKRYFFLCYSFDAHNFSKESRKVSCFPLIKLKKKPHHISFQQPSITEKKLFSSESFQTIMTHLIHLCPLSGRQSRWFEMSIGSKTSWAPGVVQMCHYQSARSIRNKGNTISWKGNHSVREGKMQHSHMNQNELVAGTKTGTSIF